MPDEDDEVLRQSIEQLDKGHARCLLAGDDTADNRLGADDHHGWVWLADTFETAPGRVTREVLARYSQIPLDAPAPAEVGMLRKGVRLLETLMPNLARSALGHTHVAAVIAPLGHWADMRSTSLIQVGGGIFLGKPALRNPWVAAECLLHESVHQKLYDFRHGHTLLARDFAAEDLGPQPSVVVPWRSPGSGRENAWDTFRALSAVHVYVHLAVLGSAAEEREAELAEEFGSLSDAQPRMVTARTAAERAHFLAEGLRESCWDELGPAGRLLIDWLQATLEAHDPCPPPKGADLHLLMDRYLGEARTVAARSLPAEFTGKLSLLMADEIAAVQAILVIAGSEQARTQFEQRISRLPRHGSETGFVEMRTVIADSLRNLSQDGYRLIPAGGDDVHQTLRKMIDDSSNRIAVEILS